MALMKVPAWRRWLGASGRIEFWISIVCAFAIHYGMEVTTQSRRLSLLVSLVVWLLIATRRLNSLRAVWLWTVLPTAAGILAAYMAGFVRLQTGGQIEIPPLYVQLCGPVAGLLLILVLGLAPPPKRKAVAVYAED